MGGLRVYRELLGNGPLIRLLTGEFISGIGDWLYIVAIFVVIYNESGDPALVGAFGAIRLLPYVILSVPAGVIADRFDRRLVLLVSDLWRMSLMIVMAVLVLNHGSTLVIAALAILAAGGSSFFYPAMGAYVPALARDERQLGPANSAWSSLQNVSFIIGPAIGGVVLALGDVATAFILNAASFVVIALILWRLPPAPPVHHGSAPTAEPIPNAAAAAAVASEPVDSVDSVVPSTDPATTAQVEAGVHLQVRPLAGLTVVQLAGGFIGGGLQVITVILAIDVLNAGEAGNGYLNAAVGIGGLLGGFLAGALVLRRGMGVPLFIGAVVTGAGMIALGVFTSLVPALIAIGVLSGGTIIIDVITTTIFQRLVPDELRGRGTGIIMAVSTITAAIGAFVLPIYLTNAGPFTSLGSVGVATIVFTAIGLVLIGTAADRAPTPYEATIARVIKLPLFAGVPGSRVVRATHKLVEVPVKAGDVVIEQGAVADRFYIVESGSFTVSQVPAAGGEPVVLRHLGQDEVFGELGLLNRAPRSATVRADSDGMLLALDRDDFLALVGVGGPLRGRLLGLYGGAGATR
jgi:MFS family permease